MFVLKDLAMHFKVICVEMYGCGRSDRLPFSATGAEEAVSVALILPGRQNAYRRYLCWTQL